MSRNQILILVGVVILLVIIIVIAYRYSKSKSQSNQETTTTTTTTTSTGLSNLLGQEGSGSAIGAIIGSLSDERYKTNISNYSGGIADVMNLKPFTFMYKRADGTTTACCDDCAEGKECSGDKTKVGFMAQQVEQMNPNLVHTSENGTKYVDYGMITALNTAALRDLALRVDGVQRMLEGKQN